tara:strand:- start:1112 stop:1300 length:189 start_codon:yes stop_codon:yes gene_type:complete
MCIICVDLAKDKLTPLEARNNLGEMRNSIEKDHRLEVLKLIWKKEEEQEYYNNWNDNSDASD